ncbi:MAG: hypothetical protein ACPHX2_07895 [Candidatus Poseidoniaceae archaeon]
MAEASAGEDAAPVDHRLRLSAVVLKRPTPAMGPLTEPVDRIRREWTFIATLTQPEDRRQGAITLGVGMLAFLLGSISGEVFSGGDPTTTGLTSVSGAAYVQTLAALAGWIWFVVRLWTTYPVMRIHAMTMFVSWGMLFFAQLLFHVENPNFPLEATLSELSTGALITVVAVFMLYMLSTAVRETRDLHVEENHLHEDVRKMTEEMEEHSLFGWAALFVVWGLVVIVNAWSGAHFVSDRFADRWGVLTLHVLSAPLVLTGLLIVAWFPQRMLGQHAKVRTRAAHLADQSTAQDAEVLEGDLSCPSCGASSEDLERRDGRVFVRCMNADCDGWGELDGACEACSTPTPSRLTCVSCGLNTTVNDYLVNKEAW